MRARDATRASDAATALRGALRARAVAVATTTTTTTPSPSILEPSTPRVAVAPRARSRCAATRGADVAGGVVGAKIDGAGAATDRINLHCLPTRVRARTENQHTALARLENSNVCGRSRVAALVLARASAIEVAIERTHRVERARLDASTRHADRARTDPRTRAPTGRRTLGQCVRIHRAATRTERRASVVDDGRARRR